jgi:hypothetical protein
MLTVQGSTVTSPIIFYKTLAWVVIVTSSDIYVRRFFDVMALDVIEHVLTFVLWRLRGGIIPRRSISWKKILNFISMEREYQPLLLKGLECFL